MSPELALGGLQRWLQAVIAAPGPVGRALRSRDAARLVRPGRTRVRQGQSLFSIDAAPYEAAAARAEADVAAAEARRTHAARNLKRTKPLFEAKTWNQLRLHEPRKPITLLDDDGFWDPLVQLLDSMFDAGFVKPKGRRIIQRASTPAEALDRLRTFAFED